jgi:hypothetical protein
MNKPAPLFVYSFDLADWIMGHFAERRDVLSRELCQKALSLLDLVTLALQGYDRELRLDEADEVLIYLRLRLRLAEQLGRLDSNQFMHGIKLVDAIGRQIGGWQKRLNAS